MNHIHLLPIEELAALASQLTQDPGTTAELLAQYALGGNTTHIQEVIHFFQQTPDRLDQMIAPNSCSASWCWWKS